MQLCQNNSAFASQEKNKEQIITCGISKQLRVGLQLSQLSLENVVNLPIFIRMEIVSGGPPLTGHLFLQDLSGYLRGWAPIA
jgi:hypothetical protein